MIHDSSILTLPRFPALAALWPGCGNQHTQTAQTDPNIASGSVNASAALKLQVRLELSSGTLDGPHLQSGRIHDSHSPHQDTQHPLHSPLPVGALRIADLGFFSLEVLGQLHRQQIYWLTRVQGHTALFDEEGKRQELSVRNWESGWSSKAPFNGVNSLTCACNWVRHNACHVV